jgi:hypothetical protein
MDPMLKTSASVSAPSLGQAVFNPTAKIPHEARARAGFWPKSRTRPCLVRPAESWVCCRA